MTQNQLRSYCSFLDLTNIGSWARKFKNLPDEFGVVQRLQSLSSFGTRERHTFCIRRPVCLPTVPFEVLTSEHISSVKTDDPKQQQKMTYLKERRYRWPSLFAVLPIRGLKNLE